MVCLFKCGQQRHVKIMEADVKKNGKKKKKTLQKLNYQQTIKNQWPINNFFLFKVSGILWMFQFVKLKLNKLYQEYQN